MTGVQVISRWWLTFDSIVWPDKLAMDLVAFLPGQGRERKVSTGSAFTSTSTLFFPCCTCICTWCTWQVRRHLVRLANLSVVMMVRRLSNCVAKRFPTYQHLVQVPPATAPLPGRPPHREGDGPPRAAHHCHREQALCQHQSHHLKTMDLNCFSRLSLPPSCGPRPA